MPAHRLAPLALAATLVAASLPSHAAGFAEPPIPAIGTRTVATAELLVSRPPGPSCTVPLFAGIDFIGFSPFPLTYAPPADCAGPWRQVVLEADYDVTAGRQFDRTAAIQVGGANVYFGTTMEPGSTTARAWHVERDVTELSSLLAAPQAGEAILYNVVDDTYTGHLHGSARLVFYPAHGASAPGPSVPAVVLPLSASLATVNATTPSVSTTVTLPRNTERLVLSLIAQSQNNDEFWYTCVPDDLAATLQSCGGGSFREVEVSIDGTPAGTAPVAPWIYTGGLDPSLWTPVPGVQALDFTPARVDLTPFAGLLDDGQPHTIAVSVFGVQQWFTVTGTLLAWTDPGMTVLTGAVTRNTLAAPVVQVDESHLVTDASGAHGKVTVRSARDYAITGTLNTSHGLVTTTVAQQQSFRNTQHFRVAAYHYWQDIDQLTVVRGSTTRTDARGSTTHETSTRYPLQVAYHQTQAGGKLVIDTSISQAGIVDASGRAPNGHRWTRTSSDSVTPHATTTVDLATGVVSVSNQSSQQHVSVRDSDIGCYDRTISVSANAVSGVADGCTAARPHGPHAER